MSPHYMLLAMIAFGSAMITLYVANAVLIFLQMCDAKDGARMSRLSKWAWGISLVSLIASYLAPLSIAMACVDLTNAGRVACPAPHPKRPPTMALINSFCALVFFVLICGVIGRQWAASGSLMRSGASLHKDPRFAATRLDRALLREYWSSGNGSWSPANGRRFLTPITVLDYPNALICDTVLLPWDCYRLAANRTDERFWRRVLFGASTPPPTSECMGHCSPYTTDIINHEVHYDYQGLISGEIIARLVELACTSNRMVEGIALIELVHHRNLPSNTWMSIYAVATNQEPRFFLLGALARNPATPMEMFPVLAKHPDYDVRRSVAVNTSTPLDVLQTLEEDARISIDRERGKTSPSWWDINKSQAILDLIQRRRDCANKAWDATP